MINTARGQLINEADLLEALREKRIAGAGLDVLEVEPTYGTPFAAFDNVVLTPHAIAYTYEARERSVVGALQNVLDVLAGKRPASVVNPDVYAD